MDDGAISHHAVPHVRGALALPLSDDHVHQRCPVTRYRLDHEQEKIHAARTTLPHVHREGIVRWRNLLLHHWCRGVGYWLRACYRARSHVLSPSHVYLRLVDEFILHLPDRLWRSLHDHELRVLLCTAINRGARPGMVLWVGAAARPVLLVLHHHAGDELVAYWKRNRAEEIEEELFLWLRHCNILDSHPVVHILDARAELAQSGGFFFHDQLGQSHATSWWPRVAFTLILVLFYVVAALYMIIEARSSTVAAQKSFMRGLAFLFTFLALMELVVVLYSVLYHPPYGFALIPNTIDSTAGSGNGVRGDLGLAIEFAGISVIYITFCIEKYIKNSKSYILTKIILILAIAGSLAFFFSYVPDISNAKWYKTGGYAFLAFPVIGMVFGMLLILVTYGQLAKQTSGDIRKNSITIMVGFLITIAAVILHTLRGNLPLFPFNWLVFIVLNIVGIVILMQGILKSSY